MKKIYYFIFLFLFFIQIICAQNLKKNKIFNYPVIKPDTSIDYYFGKKVVDSYRNLEDFESENVKAWIKEQNILFDTIIHNITSRDSLRNEIRALLKKQKTWASYPRVSAKRVFYPMGGIYDNDIERLVFTDSLHKEPVELFTTKEINEKSKSTYTFNYYEPSFNGKYIAFGISPNGNEKASIFILDVEKKELLPDKIERGKIGNIQWIPDGTGFFYIQDKEILTEQDKKMPYEDRCIKFHKLFSDSKYDKVVLSRLLNTELALNKNELPMLFTFPSSCKVLVNTANNSGQYYSIYYANLVDVLSKPAEAIIWTKICDEEEKIGSNVLYNDRFFGQSFKHNPDGQLITMTLPNLSPTVLYDAIGFSLDDMVITNKYLYITTIEKGLNKLLRVNPENCKIENIKLPYLGGLKLRPKFTVVSFYQPADYLMFTLSGYDNQWSEYTCDKLNHVRKINIFPEVQYSNTPLDIVVKETEAPSHDGVMVPLSIIYKKGIKLDGTNPAIIYCYGAYGNSMKPSFDRNRLAWFNHGGIYAVAHIRGGSEKGENWYKGGFKATKPNSWKDLIACAEYLIKNKYTSSPKLAAMGASAGGIAVGRAITENPGLFKAAIIYVGVLNPVRMENTFKTSSVSEYGTVKDSLEFQFLLNMDTYHHIQEGKNYPSMLITASKNDSRLAPWIPAKAAAKFQQVSNGNNIVLFRVDEKGHYNYPLDTDVYSFLLWQLGNPDFKLKEKDSMFKTVQK